MGESKQQPSVGPTPGTTDPTEPLGPTEPLTPTKPVTPRDPDPILKEFPEIHDAEEKQDKKR